MAGLLETLHTVRILGGSGVLRPMAPSKFVRTAGLMRAWGPSPAAGFAASAIRNPERTAIIDEAGALTFREVHERSNALARALGTCGVEPGHSVGMMCRNHRWFIDAVIACAKLGAHVILMNTMFSGPQLVEVAKREGVKALIYDPEFAELLAGLPDMPRFATGSLSEAADDMSLERLLGESTRDDLAPPRQAPRTVILTSGTTGTPKGAQRRPPASLQPAAALLSTIPLGADERTLVAAPLFHSWGLAHFNLGLLLRSTYVLRRRFDPEATLRTLCDEDCSALVVVPVMMQRMLRLPDEVKRRYRPARLRVTAVSGSALPGELATEWMDTFGDNLYNLYGSTEVAWASIATPQDLRAAPGTAGRVPYGTRVRVVDPDGRDLPPHETGRIFVGNEMAFEGYTGGGNKAQLGGLLSSGDVGHFDEAGRLFIDGRDDEMIISGGENVFPREVEDLIAAHPAAEEVAVIGVPDPEWGQRLKAFVVLTAGQSWSEQDIKAHVKTNLASYKVPREVAFMDQLPRNATGKILKRELA